MQWLVSNNLQVCNVLFILVMRCLTTSSVDRQKGEGYAHTKKLLHSLLYLCFYIKEIICVKYERYWREVTSDINAWLH
jgi:hypothetical protein